LTRVRQILQALTSASLPHTSAPLRYAIAPAAVLLSILVQYVLLPEPAIAPFVVFFFSVALVSWLAGRRPGLLSVLLSAAAGNYLFIKPHVAWSLSGHALTATALFTVSSAAVALLCAAFRDALLDAQRAAAVLRRQSDLLRLSHDAIFVWQLNGGIETWNRGAEEIYGFSEQEALGNFPHDLLHTEFPCPWAEIEGDLRQRGRWDGELIHRTREGRTVTASVKLQLVRSEDGAERVLESAHDITTRKRAERERATTVEFLRLVNESRRSADLIRAAGTFFQEQSGCDAVGIRLREGDDYPYFEARGFTREFVLVENQLCARDEAGEPRRDATGNPVLECMCGNVIRGRFDPAKPFFTPSGSFWTNSTTDLLASATEADRQGRTHNRCNGEGHESVALMALRIGESRLGLLQLNDQRRNRFTIEQIAFWERLADYLAVALAKLQAEEALRETKDQLEIRVKDRTTELEQANRALQAEIAERKEAEEELRRHKEHFEELVRERTRELQAANAQLQGEISERKLVEEALRESQERMKRAQEISHLGSWELDLLNNRLAWSDEVYRIFGLQPQEFGATYEAFLAAVHPDDRAAVDAAYSGSLREGRDTYEITHRIVRRPSGEVRIVREKCEHIREGSGRIVRSVGMVHDVTEHRLAEEVLKDADRRKDQFLALLAHELRNPLAPIRNCLRLIRMRSNDPVTVEQAGDIAERQMTHLVRLVDDLLDVSRIARGKIELQRERVDLKAIIHSALDTSRPQIQRARHLLGVSLPEEPIYVEADAVRLAQAVSNLLINAAKYTPEGGNIELRAGREAGDVVIAVQDDGMGIPQDRLAEIFEMFTQVDSPVTRAQGGLGIGLSLVKSLVEMHGGHVEAWSAGIDRGSTFTVRLPLTGGELQEGHAKSKGTPDSPARGRRILVVDDNPDAVRSTAMLLALRGHEVRTATSGTVALEVARQFRPEVALLDVGMPGMDGYEVARRLRREPTLRQVLLVALTGWSKDEDRQRSREAGFDHHLVKPVDLEQLHTLLTEPGKGRHGL
jgi:PAS domain S-box-containing protein